MAKLKLVEATAANGIWGRLLTNWEKQLKAHGDPEGWAQPYLDHATKIVNESGNDPRYGIFVVCGERKGVPSAPYEGYVHVNFKLPKTPHSEIRLVWSRIAPRFQFEDLRDQVAEVQATFLFGALELTTSRRAKPPIKMFLGNPIDIAFGRNFALIVNRMPAKRLNALVRGNWLYISRP